MKLRAAAFLGLALATAAACAIATGDVRGGGDRLDAEAPFFDAGGSFCFDDALEVEAGTEPPGDAGAADAEAGSDAAVAEDAGRVSPFTWTSLYTDFFGRGAVGSCANDISCHGAPDQSGAMSSTFWCGNRKECRERLFASNLVRDPDAGFAPGETDPRDGGPAFNLLSILRSERNPGGIMPKRPSCAFSARSVDRIDVWARNGALDD